MKTSYKALLIAIIMIVACAGANAQTYYNLRYSWAEIEDAIQVIVDSLETKLAGKLDTGVKWIEVEENSGVSSIVDMQIDEALANSEHGYVFSIDGSPVLQVSASTVDGSTVDQRMVAIGANGPDTGYTLTVAGAAIADRWDVSGADFAEYFESSFSIPLGTSVVISAGMIRPALPGELPFGVTSAGAGFIGNTGKPAQKYVMTALGDTVYVSRDYVEITRESKFSILGTIKSLVPVDRLEKVPEGAKIITKTEPIKNSDYGTKYIPHRENPKYQLVGLVGQIPLRKNQPTAPNWFFIKELDKDTDLWLVK